MDTTWQKNVHIQACHNAPASFHLQAHYNSGNGKNAKLEVIAAVLMKFQVVWDMIPWHMVLWCLDTEYGGGGGLSRNVGGYLLTDRAVPEDWSFLEWMLLQYREHETILLLTGSDHKLRTELDPPAGKSMPVWDLMTHYSCGCMLIWDRGWGTREQFVTVSATEPWALQSGHQFHRHCQNPRILDIQVCLIALFARSLHLWVNRWSTVRSHRFALLL